MARGVLGAKKPSDAKFDILKLVMSFFVVAIHMALLPEILYPWLRMAVPLFFIMTGFFFFKKLDRISDYAQQKNAVKDFVLRNLKLYAFWTILFLPYIVYIRRDVYFGHETVFGDIFAVIRAVLFSGTFTASWYIVASIYGALIIFFLLRKLPNSVLFVIAIVLYAIASLTSAYEVIIFKSDVVKTAYDIFCTYIEVPATSFLTAVAWMICGKCFAQGMFGGTKTVYIVLSVVSAVALYAEWLFVRHLDSTINNDCYLMLMPFCIGVFGWINNCGKLNLKYAINIRRCSTIVFVTHGVVARTIVISFRKVLHIEATLLCYVLVIAVCICIYLFMEWLHNKCEDKWLGRILRCAF